MNYTGSGNGAAPAGKRVDIVRNTYFKGKICSRCVLLEICCASMVRYKIYRLLEHRWEAASDDRGGFSWFSRMGAL